MSGWPSQEELWKEGNAAWHQARDNARNLTKGREKSAAFWLNQRRAKLARRGNRISDPEVRTHFVVQHPEVREWYDIDEEVFKPEQKLQ